MGASQTWVKEKNVQFGTEARRMGIPKIRLPAPAAARSVKIPREGGGRARGLRRARRGQRGCGRQRGLQSRANAQPRRLRRCSRWPPRAWRASAFRAEQLVELAQWSLLEKKKATVFQLAGVYFMGTNKLFIFSWLASNIPHLILNLKIYINLTHADMP